MDSKARCLGDLVLPRAKLGKLAAQLLKRDLSDEAIAAAQMGANICACAVAATLAHAAWSVHNKVGRPISLRSGEHKLLPFKDFAAVASGELATGALLQKLEEMGVASLPVHTTQDSKCRAKATLGRTTWRAAARA